jgi:hypothetical protein
LPDNDGVLVEISDVCASDAFGVLLHDHPSEVGIEETLADRVRVLVGVGITVVSTVVSSPPSDGTFNGTTTERSKNDSQRKSGRV